MRAALPLPVKRVLEGSEDPGRRVAIDELAVQRVWRGVERRRARAYRTGRARLVFALAASLAMFGVAAVLLLRPSAPAPRAAVDAGPLRLSDGSPLGVLTASSPAVRVAALSDGSVITLRGDGQLLPLENSGSVFAATLRSGAAELDVRPGGPRRWSIECALATVEVVGTHLFLDTSPSHLHVAVEHGIVLVRGERVPDRVQRLVDGQALDVDAAPNVAAGPVPAQASTPTGSGSAATTSAVPPTTPWRDLARRGAYDDAYSSLGTSGIALAAREAPVDDLLALADVARLSNHPREAVLPLSTIVATHADDPRAPLAAFTLGRLELDTLGDPAHAADAFAEAVALGVPAGLAEDAYARLVEARARAGDKAGARRAAAEYTARFPGGSRSPAMARWIERE